MDPKPLVSVVIPVHNGANYVGDAIRSVLDQTYPNIEIIVVDDGSTDAGATAAVLRRFGNAIRYVHKPNGGVATALNLGIDVMHGSLFCWLSHDDLYKPEKVAVQVEAWRRFGRPCVVVGDFEVMDETGTLLGTVEASRHNLPARPLDGVFHGVLNGCAMLIPRALFDRAGRFEPGLPTTQDYHLWFRLARLAPFVLSPRALVRQRTHPLQGSRHTSHLIEADRLFVHLVDETPPAVMRDYDGSELRFLLRLHRAWAHYRGAHAYVGRRIDELFERLAVAVVLLSGDAGPDAAAAWSGVTATVAILPDPCPSGSALETVAAALAATAADVVVLAAGGHRPPPALLRAALTELFLADADLARPRDRVGPAAADGRTPILDGLVIRRGAAAAILGSWGGDGPDAARLRIAHYGPTVSPAAGGTGGPPDPASPHGDALDQALDGVGALDYEAALYGELADRLKRRLRPALPTILFLCRRPGGGAWTHLRALTAALAGRANTLVVHGGPDRRLVLSQPAGDLPEGAVPGLAFGLPAHAGDFLRLMRSAGVARVDVFHTTGFDDDAATLLGALALPYDVTLVDYHTLAVEPDLCGTDGRFVGMDGLRTRDPWVVRARPLPVLLGAERVIAISRHAAATAALLCPELPVVCAAHWASPAPEARHVFTPRLWDGEPLRILLTGHVNAKKGSAVALAVARILHRRGLPVRIHVLGELHPEPDAELVAAGRDSVMVLHGGCAADRLSEAVGAVAPHLAWLPAQAPETWSYGLTDVMTLCLPLAAGAIGAIPERCRDRPATWLLPWDSPAEDWVALFLSLHASGLRLAPIRPPAETLPATRPFYFDEYLRPTGRPAGATLPVGRSAA